MQGAAFLSEGEPNVSPERTAWRQRLNAQTSAWLDLDERYFLHQSLSTPCLDVLERCDGAYLVDLEGRRFLDFHGNSVHQVGFSHPRVVDAITKQMSTLSFCTRRYTNIPAIELARKLSELAPGNLNKVLFAPGGSSANGIALKLARVATGRFKTISMWDSFHGASLDAVSVGGEAMFRNGIGPLLPGAEHVPPPDEYVHRTYDGDETFAWDFIDHRIAKGYLWVERRKAFAERQTAPCDTATCHSCEAC